MGILWRPFRAESEEKTVGSRMVHDRNTGSGFDGIVSLRSHSGKAFMNPQLVEILDIFPEEMPPILLNVINLLYQSVAWVYGQIFRLEDPLDVGKTYNT